MKQDLHHTYRYFYLPLTMFEKIQNEVFVLDITDLKRCIYNAQNYEGYITGCNHSVLMYSLIPKCGESLISPYIIYQFVVTQTGDDNNANLQLSDVPANSQNSKF